MYKFWLTRKERNRLNLEARRAAAKKAMVRAPRAMRAALRLADDKEAAELLKELDRIGLRLETALEKYGRSQAFDETLYNRYWWDGEDE